MPVAEIVTLHLSEIMRTAFLGRNSSARTRFASPSFRARQSFVLCWASAWVTIRLTTFW